MNPVKTNKNPEKKSRAIRQQCIKLSDVLLAINPAMARLARPFFLQTQTTNPLDFPALPAYFTAKSRSLMFDPA